MNLRSKCDKISVMKNTNQKMSNASWLKTLSIGFSIISFGITLAIVGYIVLTTKQNQTASQQIISTSPTIPQPSPTPMLFVTPTNENQAACTQDAKLCSDGSYVGRLGPNCEFAKCPGEKSSVCPSQPTCKSGEHLVYGDPQSQQECPAYACLK